MAQTAMELGAVATGPGYELRCGDWRDVLADVEQVDAVVNRFWSKAIPEPNSGCWLWLGHLDKDGYGTFNITRACRARAHRFAHMLCSTSTPEVVRHHCDNPACVNPEHLCGGTQKDNIADMDRRGRRPRGYKRPNGSGGNHWTTKSPARVARGERAGKSRLTGSDVVEMRARAVAGESMRSLAKRFGVTRRAVQKIVRREAWGHV